MVMPERLPTPLPASGESPALTASSGRVVAAPIVASSEFTALPKRRSFTAKYKLQILAETDILKVILGGLEAGQQIPLHPEGLALYYFLEGTGWMNVEDERFAVQPGTIVITPAGAKRGVDAETRLAFLATRVA